MSPTEGETRLQKVTWIVFDGRAVQFIANTFNYT